MKADSIGTFVTEIDVWLTSDGELVVNHDKVFKGTKIDMELSSISEITSIILPNGTETLPTLDAYLKVVAKHPNTRLVLELKPHSKFLSEDTAAAKISKMLKKYNVEKQTDIISFSINACLSIKKEMPDIKVHYLDGDLSPRKIKSLGFDGIDYHMSVYRQNPHWVKEAQELGLEVNVWTVNSVEDMRYFVDLGVDYITTDQPLELQQIILDINKN